MDNKKLFEAAKLVAMGAICGDIIGSSFEFDPTKHLDFPLFASYSKFTDDTVCTVALASALESGQNFTEELHRWCRRYPHAGYGGTFRKWIISDQPFPYNSWGNGSAMRVSPAGAIATSLEEAMRLAKESAEITHNHPEGIKGAQATAVAIFYALRGMDKRGIKDVIEMGFGYDLSRDYHEIQRNYRFDVSCQGSVPEAIIAFLNSSDYESAIRHAVALGGDADTQAAIAGGIAAAFYKEIPQGIIAECEKRLPIDMLQTIDNFTRCLAKTYRII
ncbi:MAG: ADP-ribosylglycohydrolase family protein [Muribaculaceae bacterium]|nr:ADP-ribosylglycohydrolase family protein [Muribaculaceae bacterium]